MKNNLSLEFKNLFNKEAENAYFSPGTPSKVPLSIMLWKGDCPRHGQFVVRDRACFARAMPKDDRRIFLPVIGSGIVGMGEMYPERILMI